MLSLLTTTLKFKLPVQLKDAPRTTTATASGQRTAELSAGQEHAKIKCVEHMLPGTITTPFPYRVLLLTSYCNIEGLVSIRLVQL